MVYCLHMYKYALSMNVCGALYYINIYTLEACLGHELYMIWHLYQLASYMGNYVYAWYTGGSHLSQVFWEHENLSGLRVIWLIQPYFHWFI